MAASPIKLFYSYSHKDEDLRLKLVTHLAALRRRGLIAEWHDRKLESGDAWKEEIDQHLMSADIVLLLVSADFIDSDYCWGEEMTKALARHRRGEARVIPVILRYCDWRNTPLASLHAVPRDAKPIKAWLDEDEAFLDVVAAIGRAVQTTRQRVEEEARRRADEQLRQQAETKTKSRRPKAQARQAEVRSKENEEQRQQAVAAAQPRIEEKITRAEMEHEQAELASQSKAETEEHQWAEAKAAREAEEKRKRTESEVKRGAGEKREGATADASPPTTPGFQFRPKEAVSAIGSRMIAAATAVHRKLPSAQLQPRLVYATIAGSLIAVVAGGVWFVLTSLGGKPWRDCEQCPWMISLPGGSFTMGSPKDEGGRSDNEGPQREVTVQPFAVGQYEVTFDDWDACVDDGGCTEMIGVGVAASGR